MKSFSILLIVCGLMISCSGNGKMSAKIDGQFFGYNNKPVYVEQLNAGMIPQIIDSLHTDSEGKFYTTVKFDNPNPLLLNLRTTSSYVPLLVSPTEKIKVSAIGNQYTNYRVEGSEGSQKVREFVDIMTKGLKLQDSLITLYSTTSQQNEKSILGQKISKNSLELKRDVIKYIILNSKSLAALIPMYQPLSSGEYLLSDVNDYVYFRVIADSLNSVYPESEYVKTMLQDLANFKQTELDVMEVSLPEIQLKDPEGKVRKLSDVLGSGLLMLDFTQLSSPEALVRNKDLAALCEKYKEKGFNIFQVCVGQNKAAWIKNIINSRPPFITVLDQNGMSLGNFNVQKIPYNYLISKDQEIVGQGYSTLEELEEALEKHLK